MGDAARPPMPPPVRGTGEAEREMNGLSAGDSTRSLWPSSVEEGDSDSSDGDSGSTEERDAVSLSSVPSALAAGFAGSDAALDGDVEGGPGLPDPDVNCRYQLAHGPVEGILAAGTVLEGAFEAAPT